MTFVKVTPVQTADDTENGFYLAIDRISSFNDVKVELHDGPTTQVKTVYGTDFYIPGTAQEFAAQIRTAIYNFTYFPPAN